MKSLKMIVTAIVVFTLVGSAFAFKSNGIANFCVSTNGDNVCDEIRHDLKTVIIDGVVMKYYADWDGNRLQCIGTGNCTVEVPLIKKLNGKD